ncbi:MAG: succinylglutamate desuccinylase/aspartoacylase family protein [Planctomycetales bacterium]|nr:succinylglutamate desuccinylase/aspartoacylase family protein [Planctomycetales bacterium]
MSSPGERRSIADWDGQLIPLGESRDLRLAVSESYSGMTLGIPLHVRRGAAEGPVVFVSAALHGNEINGTGAIRQLIQDSELKLLRGAVIFAPVLNILGFDRHSRYLPDRRDLNRSFPGSKTGSLASRMARTLFDEIVARSDFGIDLHTAAVRRTNYPNVRGDFTNTKVREIADAFGCEILINGLGPRGSLRREGTKSGCPIILMEGGEVSKVEPGIVESTVRGVRNVLIHLGMVEGVESSPDYQIEVDESKWIRAERGGFLQFHVAPGDIVEKDQPVSTNATLLGHERSVLTSPFDGIVIGMTTLPAVSPGEPICHLGKLPNTVKPSDLRRLRLEEHGLEERMVEALASNVMVTEPSEDALAVEDSSPNESEELNVDT